MNWRWGIGNNVGGRKTNTLVPCGHRLSCCMKCTIRLRNGIVSKLLKTISLKGFVREEQSHSCGNDDMIV